VLEILARCGETWELDVSSDDVIALVNRPGTSQPQTIDNTQSPLLE
jgi:hypothetical protein